MGRAKLVLAGNLHTPSPHQHTLVDRCVPDTVGSSTETTGLPTLPSLQESQSDTVNQEHSWDSKPNQPAKTKVEGVVCWHHDLLPGHIFRGMRQGPRIGLSRAKDWMEGRRLHHGHQPGH